MSKISKTGPKKKRLQNFSACANRPSSRTIPDERRLVGSVVVHNQVYVQVGGHLSLDGIARSGQRGTCEPPQPSGDVALGNYLGKRVPLHALVENLHGGANIREFVDWFPGATIEQIHAVLKLETNILLEFASQQARS